MEVIYGVWRAGGGECEVGLIWPFQSYSMIEVCQQMDRVWNCRTARLLYDQERTGMMMMLIECYLKDLFTPWNNVRVSMHLHLATF